MLPWVLTISTLVKWLPAFRPTEVRSYNTKFRLGFQWGSLTMLIDFQRAVAQEK